MSFDTQRHARDTQGSIVALRASVDGELLTEGTIAGSQVATTTNPTPVSSGEGVTPMYDDVGRQVFQPMQVRDLTQTAYASTSTLAEVSLLAGATGVFHDLVTVIGANKTAAAVGVDIRDVTTGSVVASLNMPASGSAQAIFSPAYPQGYTGNNWTVQNSGSGDISNTVVNVTALFIKNV